MTKNPPFQPHPVRVLLPPGGQLIGILGLYEAFDAANRFREHWGLAPLYSLALVGAQEQTASASGPVLLTPPAPACTGHTLVLGGALPHRAPTPALLAAAERWSQGAARRVGVCMGSFTLGALGLLEGRSCTTHWLALDKLKEQFPTAKVQDDAIYVQDGELFTSAGASAGIDLALELIRQDGGPKLARAVAKSLVMFIQRPGGQSQFGSAARLPAETEQSFRDLLAQVLAHPASDHRVETLAQQVGMSPRNFARRFKSQTGRTPAAMVTRVRVQAAQRVLLNSDAPLSQVADECGFGSEETLRRSFERVCGTTPGGFRKRFR